VQGDLDDRTSIKRALQGVYGVFSVQTFHEIGTEGEIRQGVTLADAAKAAGVKHFVYSSVGSAHRKTGIPHFESKWRIEEHIHKIAIPFTVLRPVFFMQNWETYWRDSIIDGTVTLPLDLDTKLQQVCVDDIGAFAAMAFERPDKWLGCEVDLAGDELTMLEVAQTFSRVMGRPVRYVPMPWDQFRQASGKEMTIMFKWFNDAGYEADITAIRQDYPNLTTFERYLRRHWV